MLLSALTLAALLQAAPLTLPSPAPLPVSAADLKGGLLSPAAATRGLDELNLRLPKRLRAQAAKPTQRVTALPGTPRRSGFPKPHRLERGLSLASQGQNCGSGLERVGKPDAPTAQPLSKMPRAHGEWAVARLVDGCPVAALIGQAKLAP